MTTPGPANKFYMPRPVQDKTADEHQRAGLRRFAGRLGLEVIDLAAPPDRIDLWSSLSVTETRALKIQATTLGTTPAALVRGLARAYLRRGDT